MKLIGLFASALMAGFLAATSSACGACEPLSAKVCDGANELDFSLVGIEPGKWYLVLMSGEITRTTWIEVDDAGRVRRHVRLISNPGSAPIEETAHAFGCTSSSDYPLVLHDENLVPDQTPCDYIGGDVHADVRRELVEALIEPGHFVLTYKVPAGWSNRFELTLAGSGKLSYSYKKLGPRDYVHESEVDDYALQGEDSQDE